MQQEAKNINPHTLADIIKSGVKLTPMMEQYWDIKKQYSDMLLMFRMGDFYELFFEDARDASHSLNISLTHRGKLGDFPIPMAGIPHHAAATYIDKLTSVGRKVAICEQVEDPKQAKGIVKRAVTQIVSPGMPYDLDKSEQTEHSYMACAYKNKQGIYLILIDYTTGEFFGTTINTETELLERLLIYRPKEFLCSLGQWDHSEEMTHYLDCGLTLKTHLSQDYFLEKYTGLYIERLISSYKKDQILAMFDEILSPIGALCYYICSTQAVESIGHIRPFQMVSNEQSLKVTYPTLVGLEIFPKSRENYKDSLLGFMDNTKTSMGTRMLKTLFQAPLRDYSEIKKRQEILKYFIRNMNILDDVREELFEVRDIERIMAKVSTGKVNGADLINLALSHEKYTAILKSLDENLFDILPKLNQKQLHSLEKLASIINTTINNEIGATLDKGNLIKSGANKERDKLARLSDDALGALQEMEIRYREETGIPNLRIKSNNVAGHFIEVSKSHINKVPASFMRRQTLVNSERYQSQELADFEKEVLSAKDKLLKLERKIFDDIVVQVKTCAHEVLNMARSLALIDVFQSLAWKALQEDFVCPEIQPKEQIFHVTGGWHPLIKQSIKDQFVRHNLKLDKDVFFGLITGPNMAGKTTVMREMAIIQFLTQVGSFVPAQTAHVGLCDYLFSRLGAHDDIIRGQSTFMVEMSETAEILRHATNKSLIILDEIGRGTSTYDGLSIAWSLVEYFVQNTKALTLFSTHYHELIDLVEKLEKAKNLTVKTVNENGNVQFLYELIEEGAQQSFGIHVAKLAGLPNEVLKRSGVILKKLEHTQGKNRNSLKQDMDDNQLDMFHSIPTPAPNDVSVKLKEQLKEIDLLNLTPLQVMQKVQNLQIEFLH